MNGNGWFSSFHKKRCFLIMNWIENDNSKFIYLYVSFLGSYVMSDGVAQLSNSLPYYI